jgi:exopolyphosphatase/guanosine-5'-triphosphate,3'-diphosphate pyrophosphatase
MPPSAAEPRRFAAPIMKLAAIDLGSNSVHLVIVDVSRSGGFHVLASEKEMVRLGSGTLARGRLSAAATARGLEALRKYKRLCESHRVDKVLAVATSAIREARNGEDFLLRVGREIGFWPRVVSGDGEARLIYLAALHSIHLEGKRTLVVDVGGGSVELALGAGEAVEWTVSEKLGVLRMAERFGPAEPLSGKAEERLRGHVEETLRPHVEHARQVGFDCAVGTSGTILTLGRMAHHLEHGQAPEALNQVVVKASTIRELRERLVSADLRARLRMAGIDEPRADILPVGAVILDAILEQLGVEEIVLCEWALREGILLDYIHGHPRSLARAEAYPDVRRRSVVALAERCLYDEAHAKHVAALALQLFDQSQRLHGLSDGERALLEYAALLHDVGHHISYPGHHKHTYYLIKNGDLRGFHPVEIEMLASVARYHRRGHPRRKHPGFGSLAKPARRVVRVLAGLLRVADGLDRSHHQMVQSLAASERGRLFRIQVQAAGDCELEMWGVQHRTQLLEDVLERRIRVDATASGPASRLPRRPDKSRAARS